MRFSKQTKSFYCFVITSGLLLFSSQVVAEDDFLSAIEAESQKVESTENQPGDQSGGESVDDSRQKLEELLSEKYRGSYKFYVKLPERSRQEVVGEYEKGTSIAEIRKKIVDRYLQR